VIRTELKRTPFRRKPAKTLEADMAWEADVLRRDGFACTVHTSKLQCWGKLTAHHLIRRGHRATRLDVDNGTTLCAKAHGDVHANPERSRQLGLIGRPGDQVFRGRVVDAD
jgi:hypothetical protein